MWHMKLSLAKGGSKGGSLSRGKVSWVRAGLGVCGGWRCWDRVYYKNLEFLTFL